MDTHSYAHESAFSTNKTDMIDAFHRLRYKKIILYYENTPYYLFNSISEGKCRSNVDNVYNVCMYNNYLTSK